MNRRKRERKPKINTSGNGGSRERKPKRKAEGTQTPEGRRRGRR